MMHTSEVHISTPRRRRREHSQLFKAEIVQASLQPGASVSALALEHGLNANLVFAWRRAHLRSLARQSEGSSEPTMLPVQIVPGADAVEPAVSQAGSTQRVARSVLPAAGSIELQLGEAHLCLRGRVDEPTLRLVLQVLRSPAAS